MRDVREQELRLKIKKICLTYVQEQSFSNNKLENSARIETLDTSLNFRARLIYIFHFYHRIISLSEIKEK